MEKKVPVSTYPETVHSTDLNADESTGNARVIVAYFQHDTIDFRLKDRERWARCHHDDPRSTRHVPTKDEERSRIITLAQFMRDHSHIAFRDHLPEVVLDFPMPHPFRGDGATVLADVIMVQKCVRDRYIKSWEHIQNSVTDFNAGWTAAVSFHQKAIEDAIEAAKPKPKRNTLQIAADSACKKAGIDAKVWSDHIADLVNGTNGAYNGGGVNRQVVKEYSIVLAKNIKALLDEGREPRYMSFSTLYNYFLD